jgi:hypothetical protein
MSDRTIPLSVRALDQMVTYSETLAYFLNEVKRGPTLTGLQKVLHIQRKPDEAINSFHNNCVVDVVYVLCHDVRHYVCVLCSGTASGFGTAAVNTSYIVHGVASLNPVT